MKIKESKLAAIREVEGLLRCVRDYANVRTRAALALIHELRLAIRQANCGAGPEPGAGNDYAPTLGEADILLAVLNNVERDWGLELSTISGLACVDWATVA